MITHLYIGVDVSKNWIDVCMSPDSDKAVVRYTNDAKGHALLIECASLLADKVHVCMEHTGGYNLPLATACFNAGMAVSVIDGSKLVHFRKSLGRAKAKTDQADAVLLQRYARAQKPSLWYPLPDEYRTLRELVRHRETLVDMLTAWGSRTKQAVESEFVMAQRKANCEIFRLQLKELGKEIAGHIKRHPGLQKSLALLETIPGIGNVSAFRILAEAGPIANYKSVKEFAMAAGLSPISVGSGQKAPKGKLPVYGNGDLRTAFFFPVVASKSHKIGVWHFMQRIEKNGAKAKLTVITAGMRKLAHIVWGVLTTQTKYDRTKM